MQVCGEVCAIVCTDCRARYNLWVSRELDVFPVTGFGRFVVGDRRGVSKVDGATGAVADVMQDDGIAFNRE